MTTSHSDHIFVFGSNLAGRHGAGAARAARLHYGAVYGVGEGRTGNAYAIPTLDGKLNKLMLTRIQAAVDEFKAYAAAHPDLTFYVTRVGCGLAGFTDAQIAPMFRGVPKNCVMPHPWADILLNLAQKAGDHFTVIHTHDWDREQTT